MPALCAEACQRSYQRYAYLFCTDALYGNEVNV